jgi:hypothetical protein
MKFGVADRAMRRQRARGASSFSGLRHSIDAIGSLEPFHTAQCFGVGIAQIVAGMY